MIKCIQNKVSKPYFYIEICVSNWRQYFYTWINLNPIYVVVFITLLQKLLFLVVKVTVLRTLFHGLLLH